MLTIQKDSRRLKPPVSLPSQACPELVEGSKDTELPAYRAFFVSQLGKKEEGRGKKEEGRGKKEDVRRKM